MAKPRRMNGVDHEERNMKCKQRHSKENTSLDTYKRWGITLKWLFKRKGLRMLP
jgi:hypothetical protein